MENFLTLEFIILLCVALGLSGFIAFHFYGVKSFQQGAQTVENHYAEFFRDSSSNSSKVTFVPAKGSIINKYDLVFDVELVSYLASGVAAAAWTNILDDIGRVIEQQETNLPEGTNTIAIRAVRFKQDGSGEYEYIIEPIRNIVQSNIQKKR